MLAVVGLAAALVGPTDPPALARDLGSPSFAVRERATRGLWGLGVRAVPAVRAAAASPDPEVAWRARTVLDRFEWGLFPDTPAAVAAEVRAFRAGDADERRTAVGALVGLADRGGVAALRAILARDFPPEVRGPLFDDLCWRLRAEVPRHLVAGRDDLAEDLLALHTRGPAAGGLMDYAALLRLRGRAAAAVPPLEAARAAGGRGGRAAGRALVFVLRAAGDDARAKAAAAAEAAADPDFRGVYESLLEDLGAWDELADRAAGEPANSADGLRIFRLRRAGRGKEADELADAQADIPVGSGRWSAPDEPTLALLLAGRPLAGIARMRAHKHLPHLLADVLAARMEFAAALALVAPSGDDPDAAPNAAHLRQLLGTRRGRLLAQLGDGDRAAAEFGGLADALEKDAGAYSQVQLLRAEVRAGRADLACDHAARFLAADHARGAANNRTGFQSDPFEALFEADAEAGAYWWRVFRADVPVAEAPGATMRKVRRLLTGRATPDELAAAVRVADADDPGPRSAEGWARAVALGIALRAGGRPADAAAALGAAADALAADSRPDPGADDGRRNGRGSRFWVYGTDERFKLWMELGDTLAGLGRPADAAARYYQGWQRYPDCPVLLFLSGQALQAAGDEAGGRRRVELSHRVGLGNPRTRGRFLEELLNRGYAAAARRERDLIRETGWVSEVHLGNVWSQVAQAGVVAREFGAAAAASRRAVHYLLRTPNIVFVEGGAYLRVPQQAAAHDARAELAAGRYDEAVSQAKECLRVLPGGTDVAAGLVPGLDAAGRRADADALFRAVWDAYAGVIGAHPGSAWARAQAAGLAADCRRELDAGLAHARTAVELAPDVRAHRAVLAEVYFRRGERADAVRVMAALAAAEPRSHLFRRQLARYKTAAFDAPGVEMADD